MEAKGLWGQKLGRTGQSLTGPDSCRPTTEQRDKSSCPSTPFSPESRPGAGRSLPCRTAFGTAAHHAGWVACTASPASASHFGVHLLPWLPAQATDQLRPQGLPKCCLSQWRSSCAGQRATALRKLYLNGQPPILPPETVRPAWGPGDPHFKKISPSINTKQCEQSVRVYNVCAF